jgi:6-phosphofructokinase 2
MVWAIAGGQALPEAFRCAAAAGAAALLSSGTELSHAKDIRRLLPEVKVIPI